LKRRGKKSFCCSGDAFDCPRDCNDEQQKQKKKENGKRFSSLLDHQITLDETGLPAATASSSTALSIFFFFSFSSILLKLSSLLLLRPSAHLLLSPLLSPAVAPREGESTADIESFQSPMLSALVEHIIAFLLSGKEKRAGEGEKNKRLFLEP